MDDKPEAVICPYCGDVADLVDSAEVYGGRSYGPIYLCRKDKAWVGCHPGTVKPLGRLANAELRQLRNGAHSAFDTLWRSGKMKRGDAYRWLAHRLEIPQDECHIGYFDVEDCRRIIKLCIEERVGR